MADTFVKVGENRKYRQRWISDHNFFKAVECYEYSMDSDEEKKTTNLPWQTLHGRLARNLVDRRRILMEITKEFFVINAVRKFQIQTPGGQEFSTTT